MKNLLLLFVLTAMTVQISVGASFENNQRMEVINKMKRDNSNYYRKCSALAENFKYDHRFFNHLRSSCTDFESERERVLSIIYPSSNSSLPESNKNYIYNKARLSAQLNSDKLNSYRTIISEYCRYNSSTLAKKDPQACTRVKNLY